MQFTWVPRYLSMKRHVTTANALRRLTTQSALVQIDQASQQPIYLDQFWSRIAIGLRLCKCVPTAPSPKTLKRQPHEQAPRYSRSTFLAIRKVHSRKPRTFVLYVTVFGLRRCRYPRSTSLRTPHTGGIACHACLPLPCRMLVSRTPAVSCSCS